MFRTILASLLAMSVLAVSGCASPVEAAAPATVTATATTTVTAEPEPAETVTVRTTVRATVTAAPPEPEPVRTADPEDFSFSVVVLSEECYGSAGCNVEWEIDDVTYNGEGSFLGPARILYEVDGLDDPKSGYIEVDRTGNFSTYTEYDGTPEPGVVPSITVTDVRTS